MSTAGEALQATLEQRYREAVQMNVQLQEQLDAAKLDREKATTYAIALQRICETMRRVACGEEPGFLFVPEAFAAAPFYATMVPLVVESVADLRADLVNTTRVLTEAQADLAQARAEAAAEHNLGTALATELDTARQHFAEARAEVELLKKHIGDLHHVTEPVIGIVRLDQATSLAQMANKALPVFDRSAALLHPEVEWPALPVRSVK